MPKTLLLDQTAWDLVLDASGNIALADEPYAIAQDVATAIRTFLGECLYDTSLGMPHWQSILGKLPPPAYIKAQLEKVATAVTGVVSATATITGFADRAIQGQINITDSRGLTYTLSMAAATTTDAVTASGVLVNGLDQTVIAYQSASGGYPTVVTGS